MWRTQQQRWRLPCLVWRLIFYPWSQLHANKMVFGNRVAMCRQAQVRSLVLQHPDQSAEIVIWQRFRLFLAKFE